VSTWPDHCHLCNAKVVVFSPTSKKITHSRNCTWRDNESWRGPKPVKFKFKPGDAVIAYAGTAVQRKGVVSSVTPEGQYWVGYGYGCALCDETELTEVQAMKFKPEQRVWIHNADNPRVPGVVKVLSGKVGMFDIYSVEVAGTQHTMAFKECELTRRGTVERIGGLAKVREGIAEAQLQAELDAEDWSGSLGVPDDELTPVQLQQRFDTEDGWGNHPRFDMADWRHEVLSGYTRLGYWEWVSFKLNE